MSAWTDAKERALLAADQRQMRVIPLSVSKLPAIRSPHKDDTPSGPKCRGECGQLGHGVHDASDDPSRIEAMFAAAPHAAGYGIACGQPPHYMIGLDLDRKNGVDGVWELRKIAAKNRIIIPRTVVIRTPSGGWHAWWTGPADVKVRNRAGIIAPGIDVRGHGGYLVGPGSQGRNGIYTVETSHDTEVSPIPEKLLELMTATKERRPTERLSPASARLTGGGGALVGLVRHVIEAPEGTRNERLFWAACRAYEHAAAGRFSASAAEAALLQAAGEAGLPDREAEATIESARDTIGAPL